LGIIDLVRDLLPRMQRQSNLIQMEDVRKYSDRTPISSFQESDMTDPAEFERILEDFGCADGDGLNYFKCHHKRYNETLGLLGKVGKFRLLELGGSYPYAFTLLLRATFPEAEIVLGQYEDAKCEQISLSNIKTGDVISLESKSFNLEIDRWPFTENYFDVVLCMEILEHLLLDPCFVFREAHRVLHPGGRLIVTTPNIACYESLSNLINLQTPYRYGLYSRHGAYGRHNREYVPLEVELIGKGSGFTTAMLATKDVYESTNDTENLQEQFPDKPEMRRQNIFYVGIKEERPFSPYPLELFDYDPDIYKAKIEIKKFPNCVRHNESICGNLKLHNLGRYTWQISGKDVTRLGIQLFDKQGNLIARDFRRIDLLFPLLPGESAKLDFTISGVSNPGEYVLRFDMVRERVCWFSEVKCNFVDKQIDII